MDDVWVAFLIFFLKSFLLFVLFLCYNNCCNVCLCLYCSLFIIFFKNLLFFFVSEMPDISFIGSFLLSFSLPFFCVKIFYAFPPLILIIF